jgi:hypothetical protein
MKRIRLILILTGVVVGVVVGLSLRAPLHADAPQAKEAPAIADGTPAIDKMIAELKAVGELVKQLDDAKFDVRQQAAERLIRIGKPAVEPLKRVLEAKPNLETANRISSIISAIRRKDNVAVFAKTAELRAKLAKTVDLENGFAPNTTLSDALDFLAQRHDISILVDSQAFAIIGVQRPEETPVSLPKMTGVRLGTMLRMLVGQVRGDKYNGSFVVRDGHVEVTTAVHSNIDVMLALGNATLLPHVQVDFDNVALDEALRELADSTGISVVIDKKVGRKAQEGVTASLNDVGIDTAVRLLADMAGLKMVVVDNVLYVTSKENAKELEAEQEKRRPQMENGANNAAGPPQG